MIYHEKYKRAFSSLHMRHGELVLWTLMGIARKEKMLFTGGGRNREKALPDCEKQLPPV